ncbi:PIN domain-containing protein [Rubrivirga sp. S365]|uniref:PIN domain-containing protein n=1 Tax=Rubrivirga litoralis TaxID=3075598 RepID=A0ABU3BV96_9BACT|nr:MULTISPECIES: PIN domain-containing protein [unclassified Rubrivirga]MDT0633202.1 PIN domain-containing protein [Rubrivirga sp. F394]MDT7858298.1 PIN domain-containing protein [Rubrivirga sp. S365]
MLLDSVIVIDRLNRVPEALTFFGQHADLAVSAVTVAEVLAGAEEDGHADVSAFLSTFAFLNMDLAIAERTGRLRRTERWKLPDAIQAATAQHHGLQLVTRNTKDFKPERHPFILVPYTL